MKILFLDIDGCLNSEKYYASNRYAKQNISSFYSENDIDTFLIHYLNEIVEQTNCNIVIISSWKSYFSAKEIENFFVKREFKSKILDVAPHYPGDTKEEDIWNWIDQNQNIDIEFLAIIEDWNEIKDFREYWIQPNPDVGLTESDKEKVIDVLNNKKFKIP